MTAQGVNPSEMFDDDPQLLAFARDLQEAAAQAPLPEIGPALAAVLEGRAVAPHGTAPRPARTRRRGGLRWVVGASVFGLGVGGLGVAGALPGPVQRSVARVANVVGVELPEAPVEHPGKPAESPPSSIVVVPPTVAVDHANEHSSIHDGRIEVEPGTPPTTAHDASADAAEHASDSGEEHGKVDDPHGSADADTDSTPTTTKGDDERETHSRRVMNTDGADLSDAPSTDQ